MSLAYRPHLDEILSCRTAPFREGRVIAVLSRVLKENAIPHFQDPVGNIIVGAKSRADYRRIMRSTSPEPLRILIAHMDHPGFHGVKWRAPGQLEVIWHGGTPTFYLEGAQVWLGDRKGFEGKGILAEAQLLASKRAIESGVVHCDLSRPLPKDPKSIFGSFHFHEGAHEERDLIYSNAADDLIGCFAILSLAISHYGKKGKSRKKAPFLGLLTRAEEVGFIGAIAHFELGWWKKSRRKLLAVSLETSRALPGAEIGKGPVVRLGDRYTVFHPESLRVFSDLAQKALPDRHQRRVMDGGTCEGTAATAYGLPTIAISVPLGNYHNQSFEGGPLSRGPLGPAPEFVSLSDIEGMITLLEAAVAPGTAWEKAWQSKRVELKRSLKKYRALLREADYSRG